MFEIPYFLGMLVRNLTKIYFFLPALRNGRVSRMRIVSADWNHQMIGQRATCSHNYTPTIFIISAGKFSDEESEVDFTETTSSGVLRSKAILCLGDLALALAQ